MSNSNNSKPQEKLPRRAGHTNLLLRRPSSKKPTSSNSSIIDNCRRRRSAVVKNSKNFNFRWEKHHQQQHALLVNSRRTILQRMNQGLLYLPFDSSVDNSMNSEITKALYNTTNNNNNECKQQKNTTLSQIENLATDGMKLGFMLYDKEEIQYVNDSTVDLSFSSLAIK